MVVYLTGAYSALDDIYLYAEAIQLGAYDFLVRPLEADELRRVLRGQDRTASSGLRGLFSSP